MNHPSIHCIHQFPVFVRVCACVCARARPRKQNECACIAQAQREWPSKIHQMTMALRVKEDEVHKMVLRVDEVRTDRPTERASCAGALVVATTMYVCMCVCMSVNQPHYCYIVHSLANHINNVA